MPFERIKSLLASFLPSTIPLSLASPSPNAPDDALGGGGLTPDQHAESVIGQISEVLKNQQLSLEELNNIWELACSVDAGASFRLRFISK